MFFSLLPVHGYEACQMGLSMGNAAPFTAVSIHSSPAA
jgi:hypothetical protein